MLKELGEEEELESLVQKGESKMKFYLAGASKEVDRAKAVMNGLRALGHTITHDWTEEVEKYKDTIPSDEILSKCALQDFRGVCDADRFILLVPENQNATIGAYVELGMAIAFHIPVYISGVSDRNIFSYLDGYGIEKIKDDETLLKEIEYKYNMGGK